MIITTIIIMIIIIAIKIIIIKKTYHIESIRSNILLGILELLRQKYKNIVQLSRCFSCSQLDIRQTTLAVSRKHQLSNNMFYVNYFFLCCCCFFCNMIFKKLGTDERDQGNFLYIHFLVSTFLYNSSPVSFTSSAENSAKKKLSRS